MSLSFQPPQPKPYIGALTPLLLPGSRGRMTVPVSIPWANYAPIYSTLINLRQQSIGYLDSIQTIYADNTNCSVSTFVFFSDTQQIVNIPAFGSMYIPALTGQLAITAWTINPADDDITRLNLINYEIQPIATVVNTTATVTQSNPSANPNSPITTLVAGGGTGNVPIQPAGTTGTITRLLLNAISSPGNSGTVRIMDSTFTTTLYGPILFATPDNKQDTIINASVSIPYTNGYAIRYTVAAGAAVTFMLTFSG